MVLSLKTQTKTLLSGMGRSTIYHSWGTKYENRAIFLGTGVQKTWSQGNQLYPEYLGSDLDIGGSFLSFDNRYIGEDQQVDIDHPTYQYKGSVWASKAGFTTFDFPTVVKPTDLFLWTQGATAVARTIPTSPLSSSSNFLGELKRDGLPQIVGLHHFEDRARSYRDLSRHYGNEYLNIEFAWRPFISDILKFARAVKTSNEVIRQLHANSGKNIRRRYTFPSADGPPTVTVQTGKFPAGSGPGPAGAYYRTSGKLTITTSYVRKTWFSGRYTYHLSLGNSTWDRMRLAEQHANRLLGTRLTPEVLWNLAPWSWAVDWIGNLGDVAKNISYLGQDGLVMRHGYIMDSQETTQRHDLQGAVTYNGVPVDLSQTFTSSVKARKFASPYGFGLAFSSFSSRQLAIIAALGMSGGQRAQ